LHPGYVRPSKDNDLALLIFDDQEFNITLWVRPICLWDRDYAIATIAGQTGEVKYLKSTLQVIVEENALFCNNVQKLS